MKTLHLLLAPPSKPVTDNTQRAFISNCRALALSLSRGGGGGGGGIGAGKMMSEKARDGCAALLLLALAVRIVGVRLKSGRSSSLDQSPLLHARERAAR